MGKCENEKVIEERNRIGLAQALIILHALRDIYDDDLIKDSFDVVFEWIDGIVLFLKRVGGSYGK